jgi:glycosyltransferase involved in cell wall biosynthesis
MPLQTTSIPETRPLPWRLSVVMAVYNEVETVATAIERVLDVEIEDVEIELVVVESNSTDGTREVVSAYAPDPRVRLVLQAAPRGKGAAVREGFRHTTGDIVLIQDADLEYSVDDYPKLIEPIMRGEVEFTLGCRHVPGQPVRVMDGMRRVAMVMNAAHWAFTWLFNITYGTKLRDPFTMYKVFRAECIEGVDFVANRFDFDWELAGKLVRLGYTPVEIPVAYSSRGYDGGKKVRLFRDPPTWIAACLRFRFCSLPAQRRHPVGGGKRDRQHIAPRPQPDSRLERAIDAMDR